MEPSASSPLELEAQTNRELPNLVRHLWRALAAAFVCWHMWSLLVSPPDPAIYRAVHVFFGAALCFSLIAAGPTARRLPGPLDLALIAVCIAIPFHYILDADGIEMRSFMGPSALDIAVAIAGTVIVLEFARRTAGLAMPIIAMIFIAYVFVGPWMPGVLQHRGVEWKQATVEIFGNNGILGTIVQVSATFIIMFVTFAAFLQTSRAGDYFNDLAMGLVGWARGGQAKVAVVSSFMFGTVSGSSVANVVASGTFTIPMMRRGRYDRETAGAVEAVASTGGQLAPPVMGAGAFLMAEVLGVPYIDIVKAAIIPALLFYFAAYVHADLHARRTGLHGLPRNELPPLLSLVKRAYLLSPLLVLIFMLFQGFSPFRAAAFGIATAILVIIVTTFTHRLLVRGEGPFAALVGTVEHTIASIYAALHGSVQGVLQLIAVCAAAGVVAGVIGLTGVGGRFAALLLDLASGLPLAAMLFAMLVALVLGMGVPTTAAYAIAAAVVAPGLIRMGTEPLVAHMFVFYYAVLSAITPPIALASFAGAGLAGGDLWRTSLVALRLGLATFIVPFMFWLSPALLGFGSALQVTQSVASALFGIWLLASATEGWMFRRAVPLSLRPLCIVAAISLLVPEGYTDLAGLGLGILIVAGMWWSGEKKVAE
ncbi:MAG: TRAP transporter fused permease subunit [Pararhodobacter sp.]|nr:TRAP transporter fused permease subunit [Pararhodobacter sp.]